MESNVQPHLDCVTVMHFDLCGDRAMSIIFDIYIGPIYEVSGFDPR